MFCSLLNLFSMLFFQIFFHLLVISAVVFSGKKSPSPKGKKCLKLEEVFRSCTLSDKGVIPKKMFVDIGTLFCSELYFSPPHVLFLMKYLCVSYSLEHRSREAHSCSRCEVHRVVDYIFPMSFFDKITTGTCCSVP